MTLPSSFSTPLGMGAGDEQGRTPSRVALSGMISSSSSGRCCRRVCAWARPAAVLTAAAVLVRAPHADAFGPVHPSAKLLWNFTVDGGMSSPAVSNGRVFAGSLDRRVYALNATTGASLWVYQAPQIVQSSRPLCTSPAGDVVYVTANVHGVIALEAATGTERWHQEGYAATSALAHSNGGGVLYFGAYDRHVYALAADTGRQLWSFATRSYVCSTPAVSSDDATIFVGGHNDAIYALHAETGVLKWNYTTQGKVFDS